MHGWGVSEASTPDEGIDTPVAAEEVRSWASVFALVALGMLVLETIAAVVVSNQYQTLACESVNEPAWLDWFFLLVLATPLLVPVSIGFIWGCVARRDRVYPPLDRGAVRVPHSAGRADRHESLLPQLAVLGRPPGQASSTPAAAA